MLIALTSAAPQMGKSEVAKHLVEQHGFTPLKFAGPLKDMIRSLLRSAGIDAAMIERYVDGDLKEVEIPELGVTSRHLQRTLGTEWGRDHVRQDLWVHLTKQALRYLAAAGHDVVVDDMRFLNEFEAVRQISGRAVRVARPEVPIVRGHRSEGELDDVQMQMIVNDGTIEDLREQVDHLVSNSR